MRTNYNTGKNRFYILLLFFSLCILVFRFSYIQTVQAASNTTGTQVLNRTNFNKRQSIYIGKSKTVKVAFKPGEKQRKIIWRSSRLSVAKVKASKSGKTCRITGRKKGRAIISCWPKGKPGQKLTCIVTVKKKDPVSIRRNQPFRDQPNQPIQIMC